MINRQATFKALPSHKSHNPEAIMKNDALFGCIIVYLPEKGIKKPVMWDASNADTISYLI